MEATSEWGRRDNRNGYIDSGLSRKAESLFSEHRNESINYSNYSHIPVQVSEEFPGISSFEDIEVHETLLENIRRMSYSVPTPVQKYAIPIGIYRRNLIACAQTGSGKTAAFLYPMIAKMLNDGPPEFSCKASTPIGLVLAPTRELAIQIQLEGLKFSYRTGIRVGIAYGGTSISEQARELKRGVDILIATPGRLNDFVQRGVVDLMFVRYVVLDEADRMLDMGFEPQIQEILSYIPPKCREVVMCSATFPADIRKLAEKYLNNYVYMTVGRVGSTNESIKQILMNVNEREKLHTLRSLIQKLKGLTLIFVERKATADTLERALNNSGVYCAAIHGDKVQYERERALNDFKSHRVSTLVATDVASRGLDIPNVSTVINYDTPKNIESYVHRIGRTGRIGKAGTSYSFLTMENAPMFDDLYDLLIETNQQIPDWFMQMSGKH